MEARIGSSNDVVFREFVIPLSTPVRAVLVFVDGLVNGNAINEYILLALTTFEGTDAAWARDRRNLAENIKDHVLTINEVSIQTQWTPVITAILSGESALLLEGEDRALICNTRGWERRGIEEPTTESAVRVRGSGLMRFCAPTRLRYGAGFATRI